MSTIVDRFEKIKSKIASLKSNKPVNIIAVSKTFTLDYIKPLIDHGHKHFGENKFQEALSKWSEIKKDYKDVKLHMIGKLQTNKAKKAIRLFDYVHSLDNIKLADILNAEEKKASIKRKYFIQVNLGDEEQKSGIHLKNLDNFFRYCKNSTDLNIIGLMTGTSVDGIDISLVKTNGINIERQNENYFYKFNSRIRNLFLNVLSEDIKTNLRKKKSI